MTGLAHSDPEDRAPRARRPDVLQKVAARLGGTGYPLMVVGATIVGAALRFPTVGRQSYWYDEAVTVELVRSSLSSMLHSLPGSESTPPLYYALAWAWSRLFGTTEVGLRSLSALCGTLAIPVAYTAGKAFVSQRAGALTAALVAVSPFLVWYSQEARAYSLFVLLSALSLLFFGRAWGRPNRRDLVGWAVASSLAIWTHYFAVFLVVPELLLLTARPASRYLARSAVLGVALATLALLPLAYRQSQNGRNTWIGRIPLEDRASNAANWFVVGPTFISHVWWIIGGLVAIGIISVVLVSTPAERRGAALAGSLAAACLVLPLLGAAGGRDYWLWRNLIAAWIPLTIALAAGLGTRGATSLFLKGGLIVLSIAAVVLSTIAALSATFDGRLVGGFLYERPDWRGLDSCLPTEQSERALVVFPSYQKTVLDFYRPGLTRLPSGGRRLSRIDVVGRFPPSFHRPQGFLRAGDLCSGSIRVVRYQTPKPRLIRPNDIVAPRPGASEVAEVLVDE